MRPLKVHGECAKTDQVAWEEFGEKNRSLGEIAAGNGGEGEGQNCLSFCGVRSGETDNAAASKWRGDSCSGGRVTGR